MSIRQHIDLVEAFGQAMGRPVFGRKGIMDPAASPSEPTNPETLAALDNARRYPSAEAYAVDNNPIEYMNTDPPHIQAMSERNHNQLVARWNHWKEMGLIH